MPNGCKFLVQRLWMLSLYPSNWQRNGSSSLCVSVRCPEALEQIACYSYQHLSPPLPPPVSLLHPFSPLSLSSEAVCYLIQLFFKADTLCNSLQTLLMTPLCITYAHPYKHVYPHSHTKAVVQSSFTANVAHRFLFFKYERLHMCCSCPRLYSEVALLFHLFQSVLCCLPLILCTLEVTRCVSVCWTSTSLLCVYQRLHLSLQTHHLTQKVLLPFVVCVCACVTCISVLPHRRPHKHSKNCQERGHLVCSFFYLIF